MIILYLILWILAGFYANRLFSNKFGNKLKKKKFVIATILAGPISLAIVVIFVVICKSEEKKRR